MFFEDHLGQPAPIPAPPTRENLLAQVAQNLAALAQLLASTDPHALEGEERRHASPTVGWSGTLPPSAQDAWPARPSGSTNASHGDARSLRELINEFLKAKARAQKSDAYLRHARYVLKTFAAGRALRGAHEITSDDVERWIEGQGWEVPTMHRALGALKTCLRWGIKKGYLVDDATERVELPPDLSAQATPKIHTPEQVRKILATCFAIDPDVGRHLAIRYFAGIRGDELNRLDESFVQVDKGHIEVPAFHEQTGLRIAKTSRRRMVKIELVLAAWLKLGGRVRRLSLERIAEVRNFAGVPYSDNAPRKSWVTYHVAFFANMARTALQGGTSEKVIRSNYNAGSVTKEQAEEFWKCYPPKELPDVAGFTWKPHRRSQRELALFALRAKRKLARSARD
jgi:hypothetical protein